MASIPTHSTTNRRQDSYYRRHPRASGDPVAKTMLLAVVGNCNRVSARAPTLDPRLRGDDDVGFELCLGMVGPISLVRADGWE